jgi:hypothetical protein
MSRALVAVFKSQTMAEVDRRKLSAREAARALRDLCLHYSTKSGLSMTEVLAAPSPTQESSR